MAKRLELMLMSGENSGRRYSVPSAGLRLGRSSANDIHVLDEGLSRNHCLFEAEGESGVRVMDLASANGTFVNGEQLGAEPKSLKLGDEISVGETLLKVVGEEEAAPAQPVAASLKSQKPGEKVDLGLGTKAGASDPAIPATPTEKRSRLMSILWGLVALLIVASIAAILLVPSKKTDAPETVTEKKVLGLTSLFYEKVEADATRIFRYEMTVDNESVLHVVYDDIPEADRHVDKQGFLAPKAKARILEILDSNGWDSLDSSYTGVSASDENALKSWRIRVVRGAKVKEVFVENAPEPEVFKRVREALETFSRNELGIWAIQYSREQLLELSEESAKVGDAKWDERDVVYGNLSAAVDAYREAIFYLETVNPKPEGYVDLKARLDKARDELEKRYKEQRFLADKAINLGDWETARRELRILCDYVPNKSDPRHDEANAKLVDVENRMKKSRKGGRK